MDLANEWARGTLVLVANGTRARILRAHAGQLELVTRSWNELGRARERDLGSDRPGRYQAGGRVPGEGHGINPRSALDPSSPARVAVFEHFARELVGELERAIHRWPDHAVAIFAPPNLLGRLRSHLPDEVSARTLISSPSDYTGTGQDRILTALMDAGAPGARRAEGV
jgi:protein required for attachment to host cells